MSATTPLASKASAVPARHWGLSARIVALSLALLLLIQAAVFSVIRVSIDQSARQQISQELQVGERVWRRLLDQNALKLAQGGALLAADFGFRSAVSSGDLETIRSVLDNHGARIGATITALIDTNLNLTASGEGRDARALGTHLKQVVQRLSRNPQSGQTALINGQPYQFVMVPMRAPTLIGWVLMGFPISQALVDEMRSLSDMHLALVAPAPTGAGKVLLTTLPPNALSLLQDAQFSKGDLKELSVGADTLVARDTKLDVGSDELHTILLRSFDEVVAPFRQAQFALAWITALGVVLFGVGSVFVARKVTTPLRSLVDASQKIAEGDYETPLENTGRTDEIGGLANAFDQMRVSIGTQQTEIRRLAFRDRLTGLPNRARFREALQAAIANQPAAAGTEAAVAPAKGLAIVVLDLDRFKNINDVLGYSFGDRVLQAVSKRLSNQDIRAHDMVARLGGNAFAILLTESDANNALRIAQRIAKSFEDPLAFGDQTIDLSAAIGIACWPVHANDADLLLSHAELAMYAAKSKTTGIQIYDPALDSASNLSLSLLTELRHALEHQELRLYLQPKIELGLSAATAAEALIRWQHPTRGLLGPMEFIPFAEQTGFVRQITLWIFAEVARHWHSLQTTSQACQVSINLSTRDLMDHDLPIHLDAILKEHKVPATGICLEITESAMMDDPARAEATLNALHQAGFKLSIDDFGTGYSSLAYLKRLPVDQLKIDKSFVMAMEKDKGDAMIVRSTIDMAHNLNLTVVAEGVENAVVYNALKKLGCDEAQGYLIGKPIPAADYLDWRVQWNRQLDQNRRESGLSIPIPLA